MTFSTSSMYYLPAALLVVAALCGQWLSTVDRVVTEPYLDEVFHIRQAQVYCEGRFGVWDPKITTPPGLYLLSTLVYYVTGRCDIFTLRAVNGFAICSVVLIVYKIIIELKSTVQDEAIAQQDASESDLSDAIVAANSALFPPLFFFSGLYYTDIVSTCVVLLQYAIFLRSERRGPTTVTSGIQLVIVGLASLFFRQTNIFWVAVFPAGLTIVHHFGSSAERSKTGNERLSFTSIMERSWTHSELFTLPIREAGLEDYFTFVLSAAAVVIRNPITTVRLVLPYLALLGFFAGFVLWNGGVVLGDKSNHVATIHTPQMLYFWPYLMFFAFPLAIRPVLALVGRLLPSSILLASVHTARNNAGLRLPRPLPALLFVLLGLGSVHFNTIVHPFTLADNRHYVFYVFRILRRHPAIKYLATPAYVICGWLAIQLLGLAQVNAANGNDSRNSGSEKNAQANSKNALNSIGFVTVWVATTALSTVTAPLVEPRYFIIPWMIWRIHLHCPCSLSGLSAVPRGTTAGQGNIPHRSAHAGWLCLETVWYVAVNVATGYMFLERGFDWPQEPGKIQRFMW